MIWAIAQTIIATAATITALGVISRTKPVRWLFRKVAGDPMRAWFRDEVGSVVDERLDARPLTNGWGARTVAAIAEATGADHDPQPNDGE